MTIVVSIIALCVVIMVHEFGHYLAAVWTGMKVDRFSVFGLGPAALTLGTFRGTEFTIGWIPFGAYVLIRGMEPEDDESAAARKAEAASVGGSRSTKGSAIGSASADSVNFRDKPLWARALVLVGGPAANYIAAMVLLFGVFTLAGVRGPHEELRIESFGAQSAGESAGLQLGDRFVAVGGTEVEPAAGVAGVNELTKPARGKALEVTVMRGDQLVNVTVQVPEAGPAFGIAFTAAPRYTVPVGESAMKAVTEPLEVTAQQLGGLWQLITGQIAAELTGPVGIVDHIADRARSGLVPFLTTTAFISTLLGMFNLLPLPALDGGRLSFLVFEAVARRRASPRVEESVHAYGMLALLALIFVITVGDVRRLL